MNHSDLLRTDLPRVLGWQVNSHHLNKRQIMVTTDILTVCCIVRTTRFTLCDPLFCITACSRCCWLRYFLSNRLLYFLLYWLCNRLFNYLLNWCNFYSWCWSISNFFSERITNCSPSKIKSRFGNLLSEAIFELSYCLLQIDEKLLIKYLLL